MPTPDSIPAPTTDIESAAADWLARSDRGLDLGAQEELQRWLTADPRHAAAWGELESIWRTFDRPRHSGIAGQMVRELTSRRRRRRQRRAVFGSAAAIVVAAVTVMFFPPMGSAPGSTASGRVVVLKPERQQLVDGSVVELNPDAQIEVHFSASRREVLLRHGEAHFAVAKDASRPFVVATPLGEVRAVGTVFAVGLRPQEMAVLVTEGTVAVERHTAAAPASIPVSAGHSLIVPEDASLDSPLRVESITAAEMERRLAWRSPHLDLSTTALADVVAALNKENRLQLSIADSTLARFPLSGVIRADQPENFVRLLEIHYGVRGERHGHETIILHRSE